VVIIRSVKGGEEGVSKSLPTGGGCVEDEGNENKKLCGVYSGRRIPRKYESPCVLSSHWENFS